MTKLSLRVNPFLYKTKSSFQPSHKAKTIYSWEPWVLFHRFDHMVVEFRSSRKSLQMITFYEWKNMFLNFRIWGENCEVKPWHCVVAATPGDHILTWCCQFKVPILWLLPPHWILSILLLFLTDYVTDVCRVSALQWFVTLRCKSFGAPRLALALCHLRCFQCIP